MTFAEYFRQATGDLPYPWQERVAAEGLPEVIDIETGAGKTAGVAVGWLYRLLHHDDPTVRASTPPWLVVALPMRSLVDQTYDAVGRWLAAVSDTEVECFRMMGGAGRVPSAWRERPGRPTIIVGTVDMVLSRALMRGFAASRWTWPMDFGLLHSGVHFVFDEVQLLGPALATSRQLDAFRRDFGTASPCSSTWMSATLDAERLRTVDNRDVADPMQLSTLDRERGLERRLSATRTIEEAHVADSKALAALVAEVHRPGTRTLVVVNLVKRAQEVVKQLRQMQKDSDVPIDLLHGRFRRSDRAHMVDEALGTIGADGPGRILVATQVIEAGVDISCRTLVTDLAPWSSIVQRAGRCNRAGEYDDARLVWSSPLRPAPYEGENLAAAAEALRSLEGHAITSTDLRELGREVAETVPTSLVLRRRDLLDLFDTSPDLVGNDVDVSRFIRDGDDTDIEVAWRLATPDGDEPFDGGVPDPDELCRVAIGDARKWLRGIRGAWTPDHLAARRRWVPVDPFSIRPGATVVVDVLAGGYDPLVGWDPSIKKAVPHAGEQGVAAGSDNSTEVAPVDESLDDDPVTFVGAWVRLADHLDDAKGAAEVVLRDLVTPGLASDLRQAIVRAAALHDLGKAHPVFQETLVRSAQESLRPAARSLEPLAKSGGTHRSRHQRRYFRHELVSALMLISHAQEFLAEDAEPDLIRYLVGAHHGRVRLAIRSMPGEVPPSDHPAARVALGVADGDVIPPVSIGETVIDASTLSLDPMILGSPRCWTTMALGLRDRVDIGPFRLATMEALVRVADWRASATPSRSTGLEDLGQQGAAEVSTS